MRDELLIVEDLLLLMLDDTTGAPAGAGTMYYTFAGAVLTELALLGRIEAHGPERVSGMEVHAVGDGPLPDPILQSVHDTVAEKPRRVQELLVRIGSGLYQPLLDRLVERGHLRREERKVLGLFRTTRLPAVDNGYEAGLRRRVCAVLEDGAEADPRTAALIALLSASGTLPTLHPRPEWSNTVAQRAMRFQQGDWGASAVNTAVLRTTAAIAASSAVVVTTTVLSTGS